MARNISFNEVDSSTGIISTVDINYSKRTAYESASSTYTSEVLKLLRDHLKATGNDFTYNKILVDSVASNTNDSLLSGHWEFLLNPAVEEECTILPETTVNATTNNSVDQLDHVDNIEHVVDEFSLTID